MALRRPPLRDLIRDELRERLRRGELPIGSDINEAVLAEELGISRTPLREALLALEIEGLLAARPGRGWYVPPTTSDDVKEIYPIIATLEVLAIRLSPTAELRKSLKELRRLNRAIANTPVEKFEWEQADDEWHAALLRSCPNKRLVELLHGLKRLKHRLDYPGFRTPASTKRAVEQHSQIIDAIEDGDVEAAASSLEANWLTPMDSLINLISRNEADNARLRDRRRKVRANTAK